MKFLFSTVSVKNMEESLKFYTEIVMLKEERRQSPRQGVDIVFLKDDIGNRVELIDNMYERPSFAPESNSIVTLCFEVDSLEKTKKLLEQKGVEIKKGPRPLPSGGSFIIVDDPNGIEIGFYEGFK